MHVRNTKPWESVAILLLCLAALSGTAWANQGKRPLATAGLDQRVGSGAKVMLVGSGREGSGRIVRFHWAQIDGPRVTLQGTNRSTARFTAPRVTTDTTLRFRLTVTDTRGAKGSDIVTVTIVAPGSKTADTPAATAQTN